MDNYLTALQNGEKPDEVWKGFLEDQAHKTRESLSLSRNVAKLSIDEVFKWMFGVLDTAQRLELNDFKPLNNPAMDANIAFNGYATFVDADHDLHSGLYGGAVANPVNVLARLVADLIDGQGRVTIPGFYDDVRELTPAEREAFNRAPFDAEAYKRALDVEELAGEAGYTTLERTGVRPSLDVNGIWGGYIEEGTKTIIPSKASAKISMRLVPHQDYHKIGELFQRHFEAVAPKCVKVRVKALHGGMPYVAPTDMPAYKAAERAVEETFGKKPLPFYSGGSIPVISGFESILGIKSLLMGFGLGQDAIHSPNESYGLDQFFRGMETIPLFYKYFAELR